MFIGAVVHETGGQSDPHTALKFYLPQILNGEINRSVHVQGDMPEEHKKLKASFGKINCRHLYFSAKGNSQGVENPFTLLSIDVEGMETLILKELFSLNEFSPDIVIAEHSTLWGGDKNTDLLYLAKTHGYLLAHETALNYIFVKQ